MSTMLQKDIVSDVISKFLLMKCNCSSNLCIDINSDLKCSPDSVVTVNVILKGTQASALQKETNAILQRGPVTIESMGIRYSMICVVKTLCHSNSTNVSSSNPLPTENASSDDSDQDNNIIVAAAIGVPILLVGLFVVLLVFVVAVVYRCTKRSLPSLNVDRPSAMLHHLEDGNARAKKQNLTSSITHQFGINNCDTITVGNSSSSSVICHDGDSSRYSADSGVASAGHDERSHHSGLNHNECDVYQPEVSGDQLVLSQSIMSSIKSQPKAEFKLSAATGPAHLMGSSSSDPHNNSSQKDSVGNK